MQFLLDALHYLMDGSHWAGPAGLGARIAQHLGYTALAVAATALIAVPLGLWVGHSKRGASAVLSAAGALRALPALGMLTFLAVVLPFGITAPLVPAVITLVLLGAAPLVAGIVAGFDSVDEQVVLSARAAGYSERQILSRVELPLGAPVMIGGLRSCVVQILATATVLAYIGLGGLGRLLIDGLAVQDYPRMVAGALAVTALALVVDVVLALAQHYSRPKLRSRS